LRDSGFDWLLLDSEHSPNDIPGLLAQLQAVDGGGTATAIVRPAWNDTNPAHPQVQTALEDAVRRLKAIGKPAGILTGNEDEARR
jgi:2-keto-3-deoxy-L-rhamnonate aldolase RhmA